MQFVAYFTQNFALGWYICRLALAIDAGRCYNNKRNISVLVKEWVKYPLFPLIMVCLQGYIR